jgi:hypothetical protein
VTLAKPECQSRGTVAPLTRDRQGPRPQPAAHREPLAGPPARATLEVLGGSAGTRRAQQTSPNSTRRPSSRERSAAATAAAPRRRPARGSDPRRHRSPRLRSRRSRRHRPLRSDRRTTRSQDATVRLARARACTRSGPRRRCRRTPTLRGGRRSPADWVGRRSPRRRCRRRARAATPPRASRALANIKKTDDSMVDSIILAGAAETRAPRDRGLRDADHQRAGDGPRRRRGAAPAEPRPGEAHAGRGQGTPAKVAAVSPK